MSIGRWHPNGPWVWRRQRRILFTTQLDLNRAGPWKSVGLLPDVTGTGSKRGRATAASDNSYSCCCSLLLLYSTPSYLISTPANNARHPVMIMTRDQYEDALDAAFTHPLQHLPFDRATLANRGVGVGPSDGSGNGSGRGRGPRPLRPLKRTRTPPRTPKSPCLPLPLPLPISSPPRPPTPPPPLSLSLASQTESEPDEPVAPVPSPRSPFLPMAGGGPQVCRHCGLAYPNPEVGGGDEQ